MIPFSTAELIPQLICNVYVALAIFLFVACWGTLPILALFSAFRVSQLRDPQFDHRVTTPAHAALHFFVAFFFGLLLPAFYFLAVRRRWELGPWFLGPDTHTPWTIALGVVCMAWLAAHLVESASRFDRPRFSPSLLNRVMAGLGVALCLWHITHVAQALPRSPALADVDIPNLFWRELVKTVFFYVYPLACYTATMLVYGFALAETSRPQPIPAGRRWVPAVSLAVAFQIVLFTPFWMSIPKVTHRQAVDLLEEHRAAIEMTALQAHIDPSLLAGIIYVAQTRDHPRVMGDEFERLGVEIWDQTSGETSFSSFDLTALNPSAGLCQIRPTTAVQILWLLERAGQLRQVGGLAKASNRVGTTLTLPYNWGRVAQREIGQSSGVFHLASFPPSLIGQIGGEGLLMGNMEEVLLDPDRNLALAASMLWMLREQWREDGHPIDERPEILATLYNIGFQNSHPHGEPRANDFGRRVLDFMESETCAELFSGIASPEAEATP